MENIVQLKQFRQRYKLTQAECATAIGIDQSHTAWGILNPPIAEQ